MVALKKYDRIEASGLWRPDADAQRREVIVVLGDATLTIKTMTDQPLAHWSIAALARANPGRMPARFHPDGDPHEELELGETETDMIEALDMLRRAIDRARPRPGRLRWMGIAVSVSAALYAALFWLPGAMQNHTLRVVPHVARAEIGQALLQRIQRVTGPACGTSANTSTLARLGTRLDAPHLAVMRGGFERVLHLPGDQIVLSRRLVEDFEEPDVVGGFILAAQTAARLRDPLRDVLDHGGTYATFRLLTTGQLDPEVLDAYAEDVLILARQDIPNSELLARFAQAELRTTPYAYALDVTGETVLPLIEADPMKNAPRNPLMNDADWLRLQAICEG